MDCVQTRRVGHLAACLLSLLLLWAQGGAAKSVISLRNATLGVTSFACVPGPAESAALQGVLFSLAENGTGTTERAEYAQAYISDDLTTLVSPLDVLESYATVEANNSHIIVNGTRALTSVEALLIQNNTLHFDGAAAELTRSTISLGSTNWLLVTNSSLLLDSSRLNFSYYFTWLVDTSSLIANHSIIEQKDSLTFFRASDIAVFNSTWYDWSDAVTPPPSGYEGKIAPTVWVDSSRLTVDGTRWIFENISNVIITNSSVSLYNTTLELYNSTLSLWASSLNLNGSAIELFSGSSVQLFCNSTLTGDTNVTSAFINGNSTDILSSAPLGTVDVAIVQAPSADIILESTA